jgi:hypothetical protein
MRHYFHTECIESWMRENNICPLCKKVITREDLNNFDKRFNALLIENEKIDSFHE